MQGNKKTIRPRSFREKGKEEEEEGKFYVLAHNPGRMIYFL